MRTCVEGDEGVCDEGVCVSSSISSIYIQLSIKWFIFVFLSSILCVMTQN